MRKLISITTLITCLNIAVTAQNYQHHQYPYPPQFQTPPVGDFVSENSLYLPPETQTTLPFFPLRNTNNLQYQYLPATGTKAPAVYPSPFPMMMSSTFVPNFDDDDEEEDDDNSDDKIRLSSPQPQNMFKLRTNRTQNNLGSQNTTERKEMRALPKTVSYIHPIDRVDIKFPPKYGPTQPPFNFQNLSNRRMIISPETVRNEPAIGDQIKTPSYHGVQYLAPPPGFVSSTTEPAIPILRLSNEMDLDGSYSYEALGADQTHYVQHSRMENMGTDKEEQVVEGSYSYVGDNGQTYTVHYVADANGFRASGDHLPVGPPVPEIIQRSIQYNLAEEAKRPHHVQDWQEEERNNEIDGRDKTHRYTVTQPHRSLFTGRTPEAFSYNFAQSSNTQNNNIVPAPSSPAPVIAHMERPKEQPPKQVNNGPISPQITFLASQGAHVPLMNTQSISRVFNTNNEKSPMPKLMNYELTTIENDHENNKPLWRWQYGLNANAAKNAISRSSTHNEDEVAINFNDMTPEQYRYMIHSQFGSNDNNNDKYDTHTTTESAHEYYNVNENHNKDLIPTTYFKSPDNNNEHSEARDNVSYNWYTEPHNELEHQLINRASPNQNMKIASRELDHSRDGTKLLVQNDFIPPSQTVTQSYDYDDSYYEPRKLKTQKSNSVTIVKSEKQNRVASENNIERPAPANKEETNYFSYKNPTEEIKEDSTTSKSTWSTEYTSAIFNEINKSNDFRPIRPILDINFSEDNTNISSLYSSTTEVSPVEDMLKNNIFLKNILQPPRVKVANESKNDIEVQPFRPSNNIILTDNKDEKNPKSLQSNHKTMNDMKFIRKKPMELSDIINYVSHRNNFESSKIRPRVRNMNVPKAEVQYNFPHSNLGEEIHSNDHRNEVKDHQQEKINGIVKIYKTLQRNNNFNVEHGNREVYNLRRDLSPPPEYKTKPIQNLPPLGRAGPTVKPYLPPLYA